MMKVYFNFPIVFVLICALTFTQKLKAQDVHFSQMEYAPLTLNPALAGAFSTFQGIAMFRGQYGSFATPYKTFTASLDGRLSAGMKNSNGILGGGLNFYNDRMGDGYFSQSTVGVNLAYNLKVSRFGRVALGLNSTFGQCSTNPSVGQWASQYDGTSYNPALANGEAFYAQSFSYFDLGAGAIYSLQTDIGHITNEADKGINVGVAAFHLNNPRYSFYNSSIQTLPIRYSVFVNANIGIMATNGILQPAIYFNHQKKSKELLYGVNYKQIIRNASWETSNIKEIAFSLGLFSRWKDAFVVKSMIYYGPFSCGFAYDINVSRLSLVSNFKGGFETFVRYDVNNFNRKKLRVK
jgi:type IX secretion system PorP/SprF family membrane protein